MSRTATTEMDGQKQNGAILTEEQKRARRGRAVGF